MVYRVALVTPHGPEPTEFNVHLNWLRDRGASVDVVTKDWLFDWQPEAPGMAVLVEWLAANVCAMATSGPRQEGQHACCVARRQRLLPVGGAADLALPANAAPTVRPHSNVD